LETFVQLVKDLRNQRSVRP